MSDNYAAWVGWDSAETAARLNPAVRESPVPAEDDADVAEGPPAGFAPDSWLPAGVLRRQAAEDVAERKAARAAEREREARRERAHDEALALYRSQAEARGEVVSAMDIATGQVAGRSLGDILGDAVQAADHEDARQAAKAHREAGLELEHVMVGRSDGWPSSAYEADRMIRQASDLHRWGVMYQARLASRRGEDPAAAVRSRKAARARSTYGREISR